LTSSNGNGYKKANDAVMELCEAIESTFNPIRMLLTSDGGETSDCVDLSPCIKRFTRAIDPSYERLEKQLAQESGLSDVQLDMQIIEHEARFATRCLFGLKMAGKSMEEIQRMGTSMVTRKKRFGK
jgi:hypothetical protein